MLALALGAFLTLGSVYDLISAVRRQLPNDHVSTFTALTGTTWQEAGAAAHSATPYISLMEIDYALYELLFATAFLTLAAIPLRRGEPWAWWTCWLIVVPEVAFAALFGAHDTANLVVAVGVGIMAVLALLALRPRATPQTGV